MMHLDVAVRHREWRFLAPLVGLSLVLVWLLTACSGQVTSGSGHQGLTWDILKNAEFRYADARIRLTDGAYRQAYTGESSPMIFITLYDTIAFGDLNGDETEDAAVILQVENSAGESFFYLAAVINQNGIPYSFSSEPIGQSITVHALSIDASDVALDLTLRDAGGATPGPARRVKRTYQLVGSRLEQTSEEEIELVEEEPADETPHEPTTVLEYDVAWPAGEAREGVCWGASLSVPASYAWRCVVGNQLFDPCFTADDASGMVCGVDPLRDEAGFAIQLTAPLPDQDAPAASASSAWMVELTDDTVCLFDTVGAGRVDGQHISYFCERPATAKADIVLIGDLQPGDVWMAQRAMLVARDGGTTITEKEWVPIRTVVRGPEQRESPPKSVDTPEESVRSDASPTATATVIATEVIEGTGEAPASDARTPTPIVVERIEFGLGTTSTTIETTLEAGESRTYVFRAMQGQSLLANAVSPNQNVYLNVYAADTGIALDSREMDVTSWNGELPATHDYLIELTATGKQSTECTLQVIIPKLIQFDPDAASIFLRSNINAGYAMDYIIPVEAGQTLTATIESPGDDVYLVAYGLESGVSLVREVEAATRWSGELPLAGNYILRVVSTGETTHYRLTVELQ